MLIECKNVSQEQIGFRRYFMDTFFDLFVWYDRADGEITGFELCYDKQNNERSIIWDRAAGYTHSGVDSGEEAPGRYKQSPLLVADGVLDNRSLAKRFKENELQMDRTVFETVYQKIVQY